MAKDFLFDVGAQIIMNSAPLYLMNEFNVIQKLVDVTDNVLPISVAEALSASAVANGSKYISRTLFDAGLFSWKPWYDTPNDFAEAATLIGFDTIGYWTIYMMDGKGALDRALPGFTGEVADAVKLSTIVTVNDLIMSALQKSGLVNKAYHDVESRLKTVL